MTTAGSAHPGVTAARSQPGPPQPVLERLVSKEAVAGAVDLIFKAHVDGVLIPHDEMVSHPEDWPVYTDGSALH